VPGMRRASGRRVGEGALAAGAGVWLPRPLACVHMPLAQRAGMRVLREQSGIGDNIRVITERGLKGRRLGVDCRRSVSAA
jgi:hypothetical protein